MTRKVAEATRMDGEVWNGKGMLKAGDKLEGFYEKKETFTTKYGDSCAYVILAEGDKLWKLYGSADLNAKFANIPEGSYVWIEYKGLVETDNGAMKEYHIEYDDEYEGK